MLEVDDLEKKLLLAGLSGFRLPLRSSTNLSVSPPPPPPGSDERDDDTAPGDSEDIEEDELPVGPPILVRQIGEYRGSPYM